MLYFLNMKNISSNLLCPSCQSQLKPKVLVCDDCDIRVEGPFQLNEFATLPPEDLHFLRIFIRCEGRIRDMEPALGLSYPTIRTRLTNLKNKLLCENEESSTTLEKTTAKDASPKVSKEDAPHEILSSLESGEISFDEAMVRIKKARSNKKGSKT